MNLPLSVYDFLGYLASGFLVLAAVEFGFDGEWLVEREWKPGAVALYVTMAYVIGHILASLASRFIEDKFCRGFLGPSEEVILGKVDAKVGPWRKWLFDAFYKALPEKTCDRVLKAAEPEGMNEPGRALFLHAFAVVKQDKNTLDRLNSFLNLYGFCRNLAFALVVGFLIIAASGVWYAVFLGQSHPDVKKITVAILCVVGAVGLVYRYLKFYRHYTQEVLISYPELKKAKDAPK